MTMPEPFPKTSAAENLDRWAERIQRGEARAIARAITAVENGAPEASRLLQRVFPQTGRAFLVGVTGSPGAGKSTLVDGLIAELRKRGHSVGVLAVDPTSPFTGGAILGDRIRMQSHAEDDGVFIRSLATRGALGGLAAATLDAAMILDAAGKDYILIETVGVGQEEVAIAGIADITLLLLVPGLGDGIQALKAGVMEIADIFVLNKADLPGADLLEEQLREALERAASWPGPPPPVVRTIATRAEGLDKLTDAMRSFLESASLSGRLQQRRRRCWQEHIYDRVRSRLLASIAPQAGGADTLERLAEAVAARRSDPLEAAEQALAQVFARLPQNLFAEAVLDHLGVAVNSLEQAAGFYQQALGLQVSRSETIPAERTRVAMLPVGGSRIELLEATDPDSPIARFLAKRGPGLHHICLRVPDLTAAMDRLRTHGARLVNETPGRGAGGHRY
ncbi:MAG TPA: methylmalonyl Co-A mutase-associated GTPase MeaB, partial [Terriglobia bacterium]|nr:methylmalonyl Co-A mutase-associated GTPase MeaB [Terriglobia bacterium]